MTTPTRWIQTEVDADSEATSLSGLHLPLIDMDAQDSLTAAPVDAEPTRLISEITLTELCSESVRRDTSPPAAPCSEAEVLEALAAAKLDFAQNLASIARH